MFGVLCNQSTQQIFMQTIKELQKSNHFRKAVKHGLSKSVIYQAGTKISLHEKEYSSNCCCSRD